MNTYIMHIYILGSGFCWTLSMMPRRLSKTYIISVVWKLRPASKQSAPRAFEAKHQTGSGETWSYPVSLSHLPLSFFRWAKIKITLLWSKAFLCCRKNPAPSKVSISPCRTSLHKVWQVSSRMDGPNGWAGWTKPQASAAPVPCLHSTFYPMNGKGFGCLQFCCYIQVSAHPTWLPLGQVTGPWCSGGHENFWGTQHPPPLLFPRQLSCPHSSSLEVTSCLAQPSSHSRI